MATVPSVITHQSSNTGKIGVRVLMFTEFALSCIVSTPPDATRASVSTVRRFTFIVITGALSSTVFVTGGSPGLGRTNGGRGIAIRYTMPKMDE